MSLWVSVRHVGAHPDELQHGFSIKSSINLSKTFPRISRIRIIPLTQILARVFEYLPPFISQILDFTCRMVLIFILIYFEWCDTENQQYLLCVHFVPCKGIQDSHGFWIPRHSRFQVLDSNCKRNLRFLELYSGFTSPGFGIPQP